MLDRLLRDIVGETDDFNLHVEVGPLVKIVVTRAQNEKKKPASRLAALDWVAEFIKSARTKLVPFYPEILSCLLKCVNEKDQLVQSEVCSDIKI